jgi:hypothetical protein
MIRIPEDVAKKIVAYYENFLNDPKCNLGGMEVFDFRLRLSTEDGISPFKDAYSYPSLILRKARWKPALGEYYYFVDANSSEVDSQSFDDDYIDDKCLSEGNVFKTREEALLVADKYRTAAADAMKAILQEANQ